MKYPVYNYDTQKWEDNKALLESHIAAEKSYLSNSQYLKMIGLSESDAKIRIAQYDSELASLR